MAQGAENASTFKGLPASENLKLHESLLVEMKKLESDGVVALDKVTRYEFAQPVEDGKLYAADTTFGKIRAAGWEPHIFVYDTKSIQGIERCWKVGKPVILDKTSKSPISATPVLFLRGSGPQDKHRALLYCAAPSPGFASLNRGLPADSKFASRQLDTFSEEARHAQGEEIKSEELQKLQEEAWAFLKIGAKAKPKADSTKEHDDEQVEETAPAAGQKRARPAPKLRRAKVDDDDGSSAAHGGTCSAELEEHVKREKKQEKTLDQDIHHLHDEIKRLRQCIQQLESQAKEKKEPSSAEGQAMPALVSLLQGMIASNSHQREIPMALMQPPIPPSVVPIQQQASIPATPQPTYGPVAPPGPLSGGYFVFYPPRA